MKFIILSMLVCLPALAKIPDVKAQREESFACQLEKVRERKDQLVLPENTCKCNKQVGLPVYPGCKKYEPRKR